MAEEYNLHEKNTYVVTFNLYDENDDAISLASLGTLLCTQYYYAPDLKTSDRYHLATINNRLNQDIKNANNVAVAASGTVTWTVQVEDMVKLDQSSNLEVHVVLFTWQWSGKQNNEELIFKVKKVPYST